jgi:Skp family chaperone for outer membrane proteins
MKKRYILIWLFVLALILASGVAVAQKTQNAALAEPVVVSPADKAAINTFEKQVKGYIALRNKVRENAPKLSKDSTAEQIHAYRTTLEQSLRNARANAKRGEFFRPETADFIRRTLKIEFQGKDRKELREQIFETEIQGVVLRVNYPYAQTAELSEMPATLLVKLPKLPKELRYRFVGRNMLLVDRESDLIIDFMPEALP